MTKINLREIMGPVGIIRKGKTKNALLPKIISMLVQIGGKILAICRLHVQCMIANKNINSRSLRQFDCYYILQNNV